MKWLVFLIPLLLYSSYSLSADLSGLLPSPVTGTMFHKPVVVDADGKCHVTWYEVPYTALSCVVNDDGTASGTWYQDALGSPGISSEKPVDLSNPHFSCSTQKVYRRKGDTSSGQKELLYEGCNYSVKYDDKKDITTYTPLKTFDPAQSVPIGDSYLSPSTSSYNATQMLNNAIAVIDKNISNINAFLSSPQAETQRYFNDYQSALQLIQVYNEFKVSANNDITRIKELGYQPFIVDFNSTLPGYGWYYVLTDTGTYVCNVNTRCDYQGKLGKIVYHDTTLGDKLSNIWYYLPEDTFVYSKDSKYSPFKPSFNMDAFFNFIFNQYDSGQGLFGNNASGNKYLYIRSALFNKVQWNYSPLFMDFNLNVPDDTESDNPDDSGSDNPDSGSGNPDTGTVTPPGGGGDTGGGVVPSPGGGDSGGGTVPPDGGGGGGGDTGGTDNPGDTSQCAPGAPGWPDCDDQSGQPGGGDNPGDSGTGGDKPGGGGGGTPGGGGGGHGSGGDGHGGGNTDGDGDALLEEVKRFHADVNAALNPDNVKVPDFNDKDVDLSGLQSDIDKQGEDQGAAWADASKQLESTLNGITGNLPSTKLDMSKVIPGGIPGVCRPWEFDIVIGLPDGKQLKQHVVMSDFCTWYDSYIRPFVTWVFNFLTAVAVFNILYKGLRTIN
ncbi:hypothetical protein MSU33_000702 [Salmonella enterica]|nr:hypothetical protein [Salmonella enterica]